MKKKRFAPPLHAGAGFAWPKKIKFPDEETEWLYLSPAQRIRQTSKLWQLYLALGGKLDPEPDPQSPFYFQEI